MMPAIDVTGELLKSVSRSFYLTIRFLPREMRPAVALGYMLARATDSVADSLQSQSLLRIDILKRMANSIAGHAEESEMKTLQEDLNSKIAPALPSSSEQQLLKEFSTCLHALSSFDAVQAGLIRKVLSTIIEGQIWDLTAFVESDTVTSDDETRRYTYMVAGCVGEFWTELGYAAMGERFCAGARQDIMMKAGVRYGQGLQLINILRDMEEDAGRGRHYLCSSPEKWLHRADSYMNDGIDYSRRLGTFKLRFASILPALLGKKTIKLLGRNKLGHGKVKIKRSTVYWTLLQALFVCLVRRTSASC
jgi:farnesyl-diphosphate farnesyltransferase